MTLIGTLIMNCTISAQPVLEWGKHYGGSELDEAYAVQQTSDGGYIVAGESRSDDGDVGGNNGGRDCWIIKLDMTGNLEWEKNYGGSSVDGLTDIEQTLDGGYIVAAYTYSDNGDVGGNNGSLDYWILKLDVAGDLEWEKNYGGSGLDKASAIRQTPDGGYVVIGTAGTNDGDIAGNNGDRDYWIIKLDVTGDIEWQKNYGGSDGDYTSSIELTTDGGYIVGGYTASNDGDVSGNNGERDYWIVKLDMAGDLEWEKNYGGSGWDSAYSIKQTPDGGYIVAGTADAGDGDVGGNNGGGDYWIIKLDMAGDLEWEKNYGGSVSDIAFSMELTPDGGYIIAGYSDSNDGDVGGNNGVFDYWITKFNIAGDLEWEENYGGSEGEFARAVQVTSDGGYIVVGRNDIDYWVLKFAPLSVDIQQTNSNPELTISPNPSNGEITINPKDLMNAVNVKIFDVLGHCIYSKNEICQPVIIDNIPKGHYYILATSGDNSYTRKLIVY